MWERGSEFDKGGGTSDFHPMSTDSSVTHLTRDIEAIQIPSGLTKKLEKGTQVIITQALGGTYTVVVEHSAGLFRVLASDADALNKVVHVEPAAVAMARASRRARSMRTMSGPNSRPVTIPKSRSTSSISASSTASKSSPRKAAATSSKSK